MKENILITGGSGLLALNWAATMREKLNITLGLHDRKVNLKDTKNVLLDLDSKEVLTKANGIDPVELFNSIKKFRESRYKDSDTFDRHGEGWLNRLDNISYSPSETTTDKV